MDNPLRKKSVPYEQILNLKQMDAATCASLKGQMNEYGECLVKMIVACSFSCWRDTPLLPLELVVVLSL